MKFIRPHSGLRFSLLRRGGFTLTEMLVAIGIFGVVVVGGISMHVMGLKMSTFADTRLKATYNARAALNYPKDEVRSAYSFSVGYGDNLSFTNPAPNNPQQGNAIQIYATSNTNNFVRYYTDNKDFTFKRVTDASTTAQTIAKYVTNQIAFSAQDFAGNILTNNQNNRVICMLLEFYQFEFSVLQPGQQPFYDYYRLQTKIARRSIQ